MLKKEKEIKMENLLLRTKKMNNNMRVKKIVKNSQKVNLPKKHKKILSLKDK